MQIGSDNLRPGLVKFSEIRDDTTESGVRLLGFQIADVLTDENLFANRECHGIFKMRSDG